MELGRKMWNPECCDGTAQYLNLDPYPAVHIFTVSSMPSMSMCLYRGWHFRCRPTLVLCADKPKFHGSSFLVASSWHPRRHALHPREDATRMSRMSGDFLVQLATRLHDWLAGDLLPCIVLPVCPCVVSFSKFHEHDTHDLLRTSR